MNIPQDHLKLWNDYNALGSGLTAPLASVAPLLDAVRLLVREWDTLPSLSAEDRQKWIDQIVATYNHAAAGVGLEPSPRETPWRGDELNMLLTGLGWPLVWARHYGAPADQSGDQPATTLDRAFFKHHIDVLTDESGKYTRDDKYKSCKVLLDLHRPMLEAMKAKASTPTT